MNCDYNNHTKSQFFSFDLFEQNELNSKLDDIPRIHLVITRVDWTFCLQKSDCGQFNEKRSGTKRHGGIQNAQLYSSIYLTPV